MKVLIIEDEAPAVRRLESLLKQVQAHVEILDVIDTVEAAVKWLRIHPSPQIIFMDIQLADGISFEIFEKVEVQAPIIFITAYDAYTLRAFKVNSIDYLLKPIDPEELKKSIQKFQQITEQFRQYSMENIQSLLQSVTQNEPEYKSRFLVKLGERLIYIPQNEIAYFYAQQKIVLLITQEKRKYALDYSLDELETQLDPQYFFRLNRQFLTRIDAIQGIHNYFKGKLKIQLSPEAEKEVTVSRERSTLFKRWLDR